MKVVNLLRNVKGYIRFSAKGGFTERFINLCAVRKIPVFDSTYIDDTFYGVTYFRSFGKLREIARKTGVKISVESKNGIMFNIRKKKYRIGLIIGSVFYCLFLLIMNMFVWNVEAGGSERYSSEQILEVAESVGVKYGISRFFFDERKAARDIYKAFADELSWVTVNIIDSECYIDVRDSDVSKNKENNKIKEPSNLIADFDGVILSDETYSGIKNISKGNAVKEGDLLISGVMENEYGSAVYYTADGNFTARHIKSFSSVISDEKYMKLSSVTETTTINFFGLSLKPYNQLKKEHNFERKEWFSFDGCALPFVYRKEIAADKTDALMDKNNSLLIVADLYTQTTYSELGNTKILSDNIKLEKNRNSFAITGEYDCIDFIGISKPIIIENIESE